MVVRDHAFIRNAVRKAKRRDNMLLRILDEGAEAMRYVNDQQLSARGITMEHTGIVVKETTEYQLWKNAYALADKGFPKDDPNQNELEVYTWIFGMADWIIRYCSLDG